MQDYDRKRPENTPAHDRYENPHQTILNERACAATIQEYPREKPSDHEEQAHPENVDHVVRDAQYPALRDILHRGRRRNKRHAPVLHDAR